MYTINIAAVHNHIQGYNHQLFSLRTISTITYCPSLHFIKRQISAVMSKQVILDDRTALLSLKVDDYSLLGWNRFSLCRMDVFDVYVVSVLYEAF